MTKEDIITIDKQEEFLRQRSKPLNQEEIAKPEIQKLIRDMQEHVAQNKDEAGLSAIQIGSPLRIFTAKIMSSKPEKTLIFVNPTVEPKGTVQEVREEGCLSVPDIWKKVSRFKSVRVTYQNEKGEKFRETYTGYTARIMQHEYDHLEGILFIDKAEKN